MSFACFPFLRSIKYLWAPPFVSRCRPRSTALGPIGYARLKIPASSHGSCVKTLQRSRFIESDQIAGETLQVFRSNAFAEERKYRTSSTCAEPRGPQSHPQSGNNVFALISRNLLTCAASTRDLPGFTRAVSHLAE